MLQAISKQPISDSVFNQLQQGIVQGDFAAGDKLPSERELCALMKVNRSAVREAIKRLQQAGLVEVRHGGATRVLNYQTEAGLELLPQLLIDTQGAIQAQVAENIISLRKALAPLAAEQAAEQALKKTPNKAGAVLSAQLLDLAQAMRPDIDAQTQQILSTNFWKTLVDLSGNIALQLALNSLRRSYQPLATELGSLLKADQTDIRNFLKLATAVSEGDINTAKRAACRLVDKDSQTLLKLLANYT